MSHKEPCKALLYFSRKRRAFALLDTNNEGIKKKLLFSKYIYLNLSAAVIFKYDEAILALSYTQSNIRIGPIYIVDQTSAQWIIARIGSYSSHLKDLPLLFMSMRCVMSAGRIQSSNLLCASSVESEVIGCGDATSSVPRLQILWCDILVWHNCIRNCDICASTQAIGADCIPGHTADTLFSSFIVIT